MNGRLIVMAGRAAEPLFPALGTFYPKNLSILGFAAFNFTPAEKRVAARDIQLWTSTGKLKAIIGKRFPLSET